MGKDGQRVGLLLLLSTFNQAASFLSWLYAGLQHMIPFEHPNPAVKQKILKIIVLRKLVLVKC